MKFWNVIGTVTRYILAAVSCISLAQFLLLLNVGTENAGRLAGQSLGRGVIAGLVAAVWFYRARKVRPLAPANAQTHVQVTPPSRSQGQSAAPPIDSVSVASTASVPTTSHSNSSFWESENKVVIVVLGVAVAILLFMLVGKGMFQQPWTLSAGTSQARFIHIQGSPAWKMFDNKTGQECNTGAITYDSVDLIKREMHTAVYTDQIDELKKKCETDPNFYCFNTVELDRNTDSIITKTLADSEPEPKSNASIFDSLLAPRRNYPQYKEFYDRYDAVIANPDKPPVYHYNGMPYCSELSKKWW
ncbi:MAG: hypothetical protein ABSG77_10210 [Candidatus Acidiferrum sp.]|jgi:hypothetical protein